MKLREGFKKKKCKTLDIVQTGGRGSQEIGCNVQTFLNVKEKKNAPKQQNLLTNEKNIDLFGVNFWLQTPNMMIFFLQESHKPLGFFFVFACDHFHVSGFVWKYYPLERSFSCL